MLFVLLNYFSFFGHDIFSQFPEEGGMRDYNCFSNDFFRCSLFPGRSERVLPKVHAQHCAIAACTP